VSYGGLQSVAGKLDVALAVQDEFLSFEVLRLVICQKMNGRHKVGSHLIIEVAFMLTCSSKLGGSP
jgi:hypothetical protein